MVYPRKPVVANIFRTPEEAEIAFYQAIEQADIVALGDVWSDDDSIVCIHPGSSRIEGRHDVLESFADMFAEAPALRFSIIDALYTGNDSLVIHLVREEIELDGVVVSVMVSTNIYHLEDDGWRMLLHHASHEPELLFDEDYDEFDEHEDDADRPPVLH
jgi:ketosteroid isomerase-like protein